MKSVCITTREDVLTGMRLAGIDGTLVTGKEEALFALNTAKNDQEVALVMICSEVSSLIHQEVKEMKLQVTRPLLLEIPVPDEKKR